MVKLGKNNSPKAMIESQGGSKMRSKNSSRWPLSKAAIRDEQGQVLVWVAMGMLLFLAASAFALDLGHAYLVRKQLQASTDAAALAAAWHITDGTYATVADIYGSTGTLNNYSQGYTVDAPVITPKCSTTVAGWGISCSTSTTPPTYNMVTVQEVAHVPTFFAGVMGFKTLTVSATSAASKGARPTPFNVAIVMDLTASMSYTDNDCGKTQLACAEGALQTLLKGLDPTQDYVALFTFPALKSGTQSNETTCPSSRATTEPYVFPSTSGSTVDTPALSTGGTGTYEMASFTNGYISSYGASSLTSSNAMTIAAGAGSCTGMQADAGTHFTYFAASIYQAHEALLAEQASRLAAGVKSSNAMVILSDGNASAIDLSNPNFQDMACTTAGAGSADCPTAKVTNGVANSAAGTYPNLVGQCNQAVAAAQSFNNPTTGDTLVFSVAYGSSTSSGPRSGLSEGDCDSDRTAYSPIGYNGSGTKNITPCQTMENMASGWPSDNSYFFSDYTATGGDTGCQATSAAASDTSLSKIAQDILSKLTETRLIPPDTP